MPFRLGILGSPTGPYVLDLMRACDELQIEAKSIAFPELQARVGCPPELNRLDAVQTDRGSYQSNAIADATQHRETELARPHVARVSASSSNKIMQPLSDFDAVIVRTMPLGSLEQIIFRMDCLHLLQSRGVKVVNSPRCLETSIDKWLTLHRLAELDIPVPATIACQSRDAALDAFELLGRDVLVKPLFGGEGRGIIRLQDPDLAWRTISTLTQLGHVLYLQQFIPNFGYDIRVLVVGDQLLSIRRQALQGQYRTNVSLGGIASEHTLSDYERELAIRSARAVDGQVVGVDLLPAADGRLLVLEVNAVPGWRGVAASLQCDVAKKIVNYVREKAKH